MLDGERRGPGQCRRRSCTGEGGARRCANRSNCDLFQRLAQRWIEEPRLGMAAAGHGGLLAHPAPLSLDTLSDGCAWCNLRRDGEPRSGRATVQNTKAANAPKGAQTAAYRAAAISPSTLVSAVSRLAPNRATTTP